MGRIKEVKRASFDLLWTGDSEQEGWMVRGMNDSADPAITAHLLFHDMIDHVLISRRVSWPDCEFEQELIAVGSFLQRYLAFAGFTELSRELIKLAQEKEITSVRRIKEAPHGETSRQFKNALEVWAGPEIAELWAPWVDRGFSYAEELYPGLYGSGWSDMLKDLEYKLRCLEHYDLKVSINFNAKDLCSFKVSPYDF